MKKEEKNKYFTIFDLKERGWSDSVIKKLLPFPDETYQNPHYKSSPPGKIFLKRKVYGKERTKLFKEFLLKKEKRQNSAKKAVDTKIKNNMEKLKQIKIEIKKIPYEDLIEEAIYHYNDFQEFKNSRREYYDYNNFENYAYSDSDESFLNRITLNYIRHELTNYDKELLESIFGKTGKTELYEFLNKKIDIEILKHYQQFKEQIENRGYINKKD